METEEDTKVCNKKNNVASLSSKDVMLHEESGTKKAYSLQLLAFLKPARRDNVIFHAHQIPIGFGIFSPGWIT